MEGKIENGTTYYYDPASKTNPYATSSAASVTPEWFSLRTVNHSHAVQHPVSTVAWDAWEEIVWAGLSTGRVCSYLNPELDKLTSFAAHNGEVRQILIDQDGVITIGGDSMKYYSRGGFLHLNFGPETMNDMQCATFLDQHGGSVLLGGGHPNLLILDVLQGMVLQEIVIKNANPESSLQRLRRSRGIWAGFNDGHMCMIDPRTLRVEHSFEAHTGGLIDCDVKGELLVTCGLTNRLGNLFVDPLVKVYDTRTLRALPPLPAPAGPALLRFHPKFYSTLVIASQNGQFQMCDVQGDPSMANTKYYQIDTGGDVLSAFDIATTGEVMAFGDSGGFLHQWADRDEPKVNMYSQPTEIVDLVLPTLPVRIDEYGSLSDISYHPIPDPDDMMPEELLSYWAPNVAYTVGQPPKLIDDHLLSQVKLMDFVGYIANPGFTRYQVRGQSIGVGYLKPIPGKLPAGYQFAVNPLNARPPKPYRLVEIKFSKLGLEDFDFAHYNKTQLAGLENSLPNSYCNSCLQVLFSIPQLRVHLMNHLCQKEYCLACELGFLFHMLNIAKGKNVQASNFSRAFRQIQQAGALGLLQAPEISEMPLSHLIESFSRFILEQVHKETSGPDSRSAIDELFGATVVTSTRCLNCGLQHDRVSRLFQFELSYQSGATTFIQVLNGSLVRETTTKAWCERCCRYESSLQQKTPSALPSILCLGANVSKKEAELYKSAAPPSSVPSATGEVAAAADTASWLSTRIGILLDEQGKNIHVLDLSTYTGKVMPGYVVYELMAVISHIVDPIKKNQKQGHVVAQIQVDHSSPEQAWYLFNDFRVSPSSKHEAVHFDSVWKNPCVLYYSRVDMSQLHPVPVYVNPIRDSVFFSKNPLGRPNMMSSSSEVVAATALNDERDLPGAGELLGIDAEFVSLGAEETELRTDGTRVVINPVLFSLARVSVVRGDGPRAGSAIIDDYIVSPEPITDYLTRFSGIIPLDLDPAKSTKHLTTLKAVYLKLRCLLDRGCRFSGHGLAKDFRIINIFVPESQVVDTVEFFHIPRQRKISLKFLAFMLLKLDIQTDTHNSIEDARTALALYNAYQKLQASGSFEQTLQQIYHVGRLANWSIEQLKELTKTGGNSLAVL